jgi:predicted GTPase
MFNVTVFIGVTGSGKSQTAQSLTGIKDKFKTSPWTESETLKVSSAISHWRDETIKTDTKPTVFIDTPGLGDSQGRDTEHIAEIVASLKKLGFVHCFVLVLNSQDPRFNEQLQQAIKLYIAMFGEDFVKNLILCFTRFG